MVLLFFVLFSAVDTMSTSSSEDCSVGRMVASLAIRGGKLLRMRRRCSCSFSKTFGKICESVPLGSKRDVSGVGVCISKTCTDCVRDSSSKCGRVGVCLCSSGTRAGKVRSYSMAICVRCSVIKMMALFGSINKLRCGL